MNSEHLLYLNAAAKYGSLTKASEHLYISRPTLRAGISALENEIGGLLLTYNKSGCAPTALGQKIISESTSIFTCIQTWKSFASGSPVSQSDVTVKSDSLFCNTILAPLSVELSCNTFSVNLSYGAAQAGEIISSIKRGVCQIGIVPTFFWDRHKLKAFLPSGNWDSSILFKDTFSVFLNKNNPLANADKFPSSELLKYHILVLTDGQHFSSEYGIPDLFDETAPSQTSYKYVDSHQSALETVALNPDCYVILSSYQKYSNAFLQLQDKICLKPLLHTSPPINCYNIICPKKDFQTPAQREMLQYLNNYIDTMFTNACP